MKINSFRFKITIAMIIVLVLSSFFSFYIYSRYLENRFYQFTEENIIPILTLLQEQYLFTVSQNGQKIIYPMIDKIQQNDFVLNALLLNSDGNLVFPLKKKTFYRDSLTRKELSGLSAPITIKRIETEQNQILRSYIQLQNTKECYACHNPIKKKLGYIVIDFSTQQIEENISFLQNFGRFYTLLLMIIILLSVSFLHYRFVRRSLNQFKTTINKIDQGYINERFSIPESEELGNLAKSFNRMLDNLKCTQSELEMYHQKELLNAQKLATVGEMAASLAHEIKNPLTGIANAIQIIVEDAKESDNKQILEEVQRQARRVNKTINDLLEFSRPVELHFSFNSINDIIEKVVFFLKNQFQKNQIKYILEFAPEIPNFYFDLKQMEIVIINLGLNAQQAITEKGSITFTTKYIPEKEEISIKIADTGSGIPPEKRAEVFKPFFTMRHKGTGLGLAISKDIVERHNGDIYIEDKTVCGTVFVITFPVKKTISHRNAVLK